MDLLRSPLAVLLALLLCLPAPASKGQTPAEAKSSLNSGRSIPRSAQLQGGARILHALNRFTFGPRPGDLEAVSAEGLDEWFNGQLHPQMLDESALDMRLAQYPAMQLSVQELIYRYPSDALVRMAMNGKMQIPTDPIVRAIYENQIYRIRTRQQGHGRQAPGNTPGNSQLDEADPNGQAAPAIDPGSIRAILSLPPDQRLFRLASIREPAFDTLIRSLKPPQRAALVAEMTPQQKEAVEALAGPEQIVVQELLAGRLLCDVYSNAQLLEVMTDFWLNHFNIYLHKDEQMPYYLVSYERDAIRPRALGHFEDLLEAVAHTPAMLMYLDNAESVGPHSLSAERFKQNAWRRPNAKHQDPPGINENYGRELMELHTVGVNGGYTQADVVAASKVLTGWTVDHPQFGGGFIFTPNRHEPGTKKVMGLKIRQSGEREGEELLHMLATRPATAQMLSHELAVRFVSDNPPQSLVDRMAKTYLSTNGDISAVMETLFHSPEFWAQSNAGAKVKTPLEYVVSAVRAGDADVTNYAPLINQLRLMGMPLFGCVQPNGYAWTSDAWVNTGDLVDRMNFALLLASNRLPGIKVDWSNPAPTGSGGAAWSALAPAQEEARLESQLLPLGASATTRAAVLQEFQQHQSQNPRKSAQARPVAAAQRFGRAAPQAIRAREDALLAGLLIGSPEFQRR